LKNPVSIALFIYFTGFGTPLSNSLYSMQPPLTGFDVQWTSDTKIQKIFCPRLKRVPSH